MGSNWKAEVSMNKNQIALHERVLAAAFVAAYINMHDLEKKRPRGRDAELVFCEAKRIADAAVEAEASLVSRGEL